MLHKWASGLNMPPHVEEATGHLRWFWKRKTEKGLLYFPTSYCDHYIAHYFHKWVRQEIYHLWSMISTQSVNWEADPGLVFLASVLTALLWTRSCSVLKLQKHECRLVEPSAEAAAVLSWMFMWVTWGQNDFFLFLLLLVWQYNGDDQTVLWTLHGTHFHS